MKKFLYIITLLLIATTMVCCNQSGDDSNYLKKYIIVRYGGRCIKVNDGTTAEETVMKDKNGNELHFNSLTGVINYMTLQGWKLEELVAEPQYNLYSQDANLVFSKKTDEQELQDIVNKSYKE